MVVATGTALIIFFYSGTFFHWSGLRGLYQAYTAWFATGTEGHGHEKPLDYWLRLIGRYELPDRHRSGHLSVLPETEEHLVALSGHLRRRHARCL